jgi:hypothetical protein
MLLEPDRTQVAEDCVVQVLVGFLANSQGNRVEIDTG